MKKIFAFLVAGLLLLSGCESWLDINNPPGSPTSADAELVLPVATLSVGAQVGGYYNLLGGFWSQYWAQSSAANQYKYIDSYTINSTDFSGQWTELYAGALNDFAYILDEANANEDWSIVLMATVMKCYTYQILVDLYDQVPYSQASSGASDGNFNPEFDNGQDIYDDLIVQLDSALAKDYKITERTMPTDYLFEGNMDSWEAFANTLKLKIFMRQSEARSAVAQAGIQALYNDGATFLTMDAGLDIFEDEKFKDNPLYASNVRNLNVGTNLRASATFYNYLSTNFDPRFDVHFPTGASTIPMPQGGFNISSTVVDPTTFCVFELYPLTPVDFISTAESYFLQAEAVARGWGTGDDQELYEMGVTAAFANHNLAPGNLLTGAYAYPAGTLAQNLEAIIMQKWISLAGYNGIEAFFETNRTGIPGISTIPAWESDALNPAFLGGAFTYSLEGITGGLFPKRLLVPQRERSTNVNVPDDLKTKVVTDEVWWAQ